MTTEKRVRKERLTCGTSSPAACDIILEKGMDNELVNVRAGPERRTKDGGYWVKQEHRAGWREPVDTVYARDFNRVRRWERPPAGSQNSMR